MSYTGTTKRLARPIRELRVGAKMVSRAVRTSFAQTLPRSTGLVKRGIKALGRARMRLKEATAQGTGTQSKTFYGPGSGLKRSTRSLLAKGRANKAHHPYVRQQLAQVHRQARSLSR